MHFGLTISTTTAFPTTNTNPHRHHHLLCSDGYRITHSSTKTTAIHGGAGWRRPPSTHVDYSFLLYHPCNSYASDRRASFGHRDFRSHTNRKRHFCNCKRDGFVDDQSQPVDDDDDDDDQSSQLLQFGDSAILSACFVGLLTGFAVVLFNYTVTSSFSTNILLHLLLWNLAFAVSCPIVHSN
ncbi:hypothetical protein ABFS82_07G114200 [Erythranthe guttata]